MKSTIKVLLGVLMLSATVLVNAQTPPTAKDTSLFISQGDTLVFAEADFQMDNGGDNTLDSLAIVTGLSDTEGTLFWDANSNGVNDGGAENLTASDTLHITDDINNNEFRYIAPNAAGDENFTFQVQDDHGTNDANDRSGTQTITLYTVANALDFDGTGDAVTITDGFDMLDNKSTFTIEFWVNLSSTASGANNVVVARNSSGESIEIQTGGIIEISDGSLSSATNAGAINFDDSWHHVAVVGDGSIYVDGLLASMNTSDFAGFSDQAAGEELTLGYDGTNYLHGGLDELRIWNVNRTAAQIRLNALRNFTDLNEHADLLAYYDFDFGIANGTNTGLDTLIDATSNYGGNLTGFDLTSSGTSNWIPSTAVISNGGQDIHLSGEGTEIADAAVAPNNTDSTDFGFELTSSQTNTNTFTIENQGVDTLFVDGITIGGSTQFAVDNNNPDVQVYPGATYDFEITFTPTTDGADTATVTIVSDDTTAAETNYTFDITGVGSNPTTLSEGDIAFTMYNADGDKEFAFVTFKTLEPGTEIIFMDHGWDNTPGQLNNASSEGSIGLTLRDQVSAFDQVIINSTTDSAYAKSGIARLGTIDGSTDAGFVLSTAGDQIFAFQGSIDGANTVTVTTFLAGVDATASGWDATADPSGGQDSNIPTELTDGINAFAIFAGGNDLAENDNFVYTGAAVSGAVSTLRDSVYSDETYYWTIDDGTIYDVSDLVVFTTNSDPSGADSTIATGISAQFVLTDSVFGFTDPDQVDRLQGVKITALPTDGALFVDINDNGVNDAEDVGVNDTVSLADLQADRLIYVGHSSATLTPSLDFQVFDGDSLDNTDNTLTLHTVENALDFDGVDDNVSATVTGLPIGSSDRTLEIWVKRNETTDQSGIFHYGVNTTGQLMQVIVAATTGEILFQGSSADYSTGVNINDTDWHHLAVTYDGTTLVIFLDGVLIGQSDIALNTATSDFVLGETVANGGQNINAKIDEVRIWNVVRTPSEIRGNATGLLDTTGLTNLVANYDFNFGRNASFNTGYDTLEDRSGNGNGGTLNGFTLTGAGSNWETSTAFGSAAATAINGINNEPYMENVGGTVTYIEEDATPTILDADAAWDDPDNAANFQDGVLSIEVVAGNAFVEDTLIISNATYTVSINSGDNDSLTFDGTKIGRWTYDDTSKDSLAIAFNANADSAAITRLIRSIAYQNLNTVNPDTSAERRIAFFLDDGDGNANSGDSLSVGDTVNVDIIPVNDEPSITDYSTTTASYFENAGGSSLDNGLDAAISDPDGASTFNNGGIGAWVSANGVLEGDSLVVITSQGITESAGTLTYSGTGAFATISYNNSTDSLSISFDNSGNATQAAVDALIQSIAYVNVLNDPDTTNERTISIVFDDGYGNTNSGDSLSTTYTQTVDVVAVNDEPLLTNVSGTVEFIENAADSVQIAPLGFMNDLDSALDYENGFLSVEITSNGVINEDTLVVDASQSTGITLNGMNIEIGGQTIGSITYNSVGTDSLGIAFTSDADSTDVNDVIKSIAYYNLGGDAPDTTNERVVTFIFGDGDLTTSGGDSVSASYTVNVDVIDVNDKPSITNLGGNTVTYIENASGEVIEVGGDAGLVDLDKPSDYSGAELSFYVSANGDLEGDTLLFVGNGITYDGSFVEYSNVDIGTLFYDTDKDSLSVTLNGSADSTAVANLIHSLAYRNLLDDPDTTNERTVSIVFNDGSGNANSGDSISAIYTANVDVVAVNDQPTLSNVSGTVTFNEAQTDSLQIAVNGFLNDLDSAADYEDGFLSVEITANGVAAEDTLVIDANPFGVTVSGGVVSNNGQAIGTLTVGAGGLDSLGVVLNANADSVDVNELIKSIAYYNLNLANPDTTNERVVTFIFGDGDLTENSGDSVSIAYDVNVDVISINDSPYLVGYTDDGSDDPNFNEDGAPILIDADGDFGLKDVDDSVYNDYAGTVVTIFRAGGANGKDEWGFNDGNNLSLSGTTLSNLGGEIAQLAVLGGGSANTLQITFNSNAGTATTDDVNNTLRQITYENTENNPATSYDFTLRINDGDGSGDVDTTFTINIFESNDKTNIYELNGDVVDFYENTPVSITDLISSATTIVEDPDQKVNFDGGFLDVSISVGTFRASEDTVFLDTANTSFGIEDFAVDSVTFGGARIGGITRNDADSIRITFNANATTGQAADDNVIDSLIRAIVYSNLLDNPDTSDRTLSALIRDQAAGFEDSTVTFTVSPIAINDAPVIANLNGDAVIYTEGGDSVYLDAGTDGLLSDLDDPISGSAAKLDYSDGYLAVSINSGGVNAEDTLMLGNSTLWTIGTGPYTINRASGN
ncbi:MAG: choice-of-anchor D domain-containing protein, partial [Cyclobacteriaceae bacterium]